jgi:hypothetical protein
MNLMRINFECDECSFTWRAPIWEPKWASKLCYKDLHAEQHDEPDGRNHPLVAPWREWERNRIIEILEPYRYSEISIGKVIDLIKGQ